MPPVDQDSANSERLDWILELQRSPGYGLLVERIETELERLRIELERNQGADTTSHLRGQIYALRTVLRIREILQGELLSKEEGEANVQ